MLASSAHSLKDSVQFAEIGSLRNESGYGSVEAHTSREESPSQHTKSSARESREKKDSLKKRESGMGKKVNGYNIKRKQPMLSTQSPMRYSVPQPKAVDFEPPKDPVFTSHEPYPFLAPDGKTELKKPTDHAENKRAYRYTHCIADSLFKHKQYYRQSESKPYGPRMSFEDSDVRIHFAPSGRMITNEKGWRMSRANVAVREGSFYYEVKVIKGVQQKDPITTPGAASSPQPHIRMGWARREAPLDAPVGFDGYSYGLTDIRFETMHKSRPGRLYHPSDMNSKNNVNSKAKANSARDDKSGMANLDHIREGDVVGLEICLPSISLQQKIASGDYNPAVDIDSGFNDLVPGYQEAIRDRIPVPYKGNLYFEQLEYQATKSMEQYGDRGPFNKVKTGPNHADPPLRSLPYSAIRIYKNGTYAGTAFEDLLSFLPLASQPSLGSGARVGFDDGMLGYFPAIAAFSGGIAETNFGPEFWHAPSHVSNYGGHITNLAAGNAQKGIVTRPLSERYKEQIAEDIIYDILDEVGFFIEDGGNNSFSKPNQMQTAINTSDSVAE